MNQNPLRILLVLPMAAYYIIRWVGSIFYALGQFLLFFISNYRLLLIFVLSSLFAYGWSANYGTIISTVDYVWRCGISPIYQSFYPLLNAVRNIYDTLICWYDTLNLLGRLFSKKLLVEVTDMCTNGADVYVILRKTGDLVLAFAESLSNWVVDGIFTFTFPFYDVMTAVYPIADQTDLLAECICADVYPLWHFLTTVVESNRLACSVQQLGNGGLSAAQEILVSLANIAIAIVQSVAILISDANSGGLGAIYVRLFANGSELIPTFRTPTERINSGIIYLTGFLDDIIQAATCIVLDEIDFGGSGNSVTSCMKDDSVRYPVFSAFAPVFVTVIRAIVVAYDVVLPHVWDIFSGAQLPQVSPALCKYADSPDSLVLYLQCNWPIDSVWDTIRTPLPGAVPSSIEFPYAFIYGNVSYDPPFPACNSSYGSETYLSCAQCDEIGNFTFQDAWCGLISEVDDVVQSSIGGRRIFSPIFCQTLFGVVRPAVAVLKFGIDFVRYLGPAFPRFLGDETAYDSIFDELGGSAGELGGLLQALENITLSIDPRLACPAHIIVYPFKSVLELTRSVVYVLPKFVRQFWIGGPSNTYALTGYLCVAGIGDGGCVDPEVYLSWLRVARIRPVGFVNDTATHDNTDYLSLNSTAPDVWIDCVASILDLRYFALFSDDPVLADFPDVSCPIVYVFRIAADLLNFGLGLILALIETITIPNTAKTTILEYVACTYHTISVPGNPETIVPLCSPLVDLTSDLQDLGTCPCIFFLGVEDVIYAGSGSTPGICQNGNPFECLCNATDGIVFGAVEGVRAVQIFTQGLLRLFDCIILDTSSTGGGTVMNGFSQDTACREELGLRFDHSFGAILDALDLLGESVYGAGCLLGSLIPLNCVVDDGSCNVVTNGVTITCPCKLSDKLGDVLLSAYDIVVALLDIPIEILKTIVDYASTVDFDNPDTAGLNGPAIPTSLAGFFYLVVSKVGNSLYGTNPNSQFSSSPTCLNLNVGVVFPNDTTPTYGLIQNLGFFINCLLGPTGCTTGASFGSSNPCFGNLFISIGNILRDTIVQLLVIVTDLIGVVETLLTGDFTTFQCFIGDFFFQLIDYIFTVLFTNVGTLFQIIVSFIVAVVRAIFGDGFAQFVNYVLTIFVDIFDVIQDVLNFFAHLFGLSKKRFAASAAQAAGDTYYTVISDTVSGNIYNLTGNQWSAMFDPVYRANYVSNGTFCNRIFQETLNYTSFADMSSYHEFFHKMCFAAVAVPILLKTTVSSTDPGTGYVDNTTVIGESPTVPVPTDTTGTANNFNTNSNSPSKMKNKRNIFTTSSSSSIQLPPSLVLPDDTLTDPSVGARVFTELMTGWSAYTDWKTSPYGALYMPPSDIDTPLVSIDQYGSATFPAYDTSASGDTASISQKKRSILAAVNGVITGTAFDVGLLTRYYSPNLGSNAYVAAHGALSDTVQASLDHYGNWSDRRSTKFFYESAASLYYYQYVGSYGNAMDPTVTWIDLPADIYPVLDNNTVLSPVLLDNGTTVYLDLSNFTSDSNESLSFRTYRYEPHVIPTPGDIPRPEYTHTDENIYGKTFPRKSQWKNDGKQNKYHGTYFEKTRYTGFERLFTSKRRIFEEYASKKFDIDPYSVVMSKLRNIYSEWISSRTDYGKYRKFDREYYPEGGKLETSNGNRYRWTIYDGADLKDGTFGNSGIDIRNFSFQNKSVTSPRLQNSIIGRVMGIYTERLRMTADIVYTAISASIREGIQNITRDLDYWVDNLRSRHLASSIRNPNVPSRVENMYGAYRRITDHPKLAPIVSYVRTHDAVSGFGKNTDSEDWRDVCTFKDLSYQFRWRRLAAKGSVDIQRLSKGYFKNKKENERIVDYYDPFTYEQSPRIFSDSVSPVVGTGTLCHCNCTLLETFLEDFLDIVYYCPDKSAGMLLANTIPSNYSGLIEILPYDPSVFNNSDPVVRYIVGPIYSLIGIDVFGTVLNFFQNTETTPFSGNGTYTHVGALFFLNRFFSCDRDIDLRCQFGYGLKEGIAIAAGLTFGLVILLYFVSPLFSNIYLSILSLIGLGAVFGVLILIFSWGYGTGCIYSPISGITSIFGITAGGSSGISMNIPSLPLLPECAADDTVNLLSEIFDPCLFEGLLSYIAVAGQDLCPNCSAMTRVQILNCSAYGFTGGLSEVAYLWQTYVPSSVSYLIQGSPVARGNSSALGFLFETDYSANSTQSAACFFLNIPSLIAPLLLTLFGAVAVVFALPVVFSTLEMVVGMLTLAPITWLFALEGGGVDAPLYAEGGAVSASIGSPATFSDMYKIYNTEMDSGPVTNDVLEDYMEHIAAKTMDEREYETNMPTTTGNSAMATSGDVSIQNDTTEKGRRLPRSKISGSLSIYPDPIGAVSGILSTFIKNKANPNERESTIPEDSTVGSFANTRKRRKKKKSTK